jgi:hypothetical protein
MYLVILIGYRSPKKIQRISLKLSQLMASTWYYETIILTRGDDADVQVN